MEAHPVALKVWRPIRSTKEDPDFCFGEKSHLSQHKIKSRFRIRTRVEVKNRNRIRIEVKSRI